ncbi:hypothetical protein PanWU01x14_298710 [Parasponia andersonii]|uniref:Uncharacterized protein n=1 Tax=Parasponia andersonii TaxID=3476 RepID=A0A2P5AUL1_PARAD|nr:hypothetical protein PanWU01x14_298710 [Parasponia andersonii]
MLKFVTRRVKPDRFHGKTSPELVPASFESRNIFRLFLANGELSGGGTCSTMIVRSWALFASRWRSSLTSGKASSEQRRNSVFLAGISRERREKELRENDAGHVSALKWVVQFF